MPTDKKCVKPPMGNRQQRRAAKARARKKQPAERAAEPLQMTMSWYESAEEFDKARTLDPRVIRG